MFSFNPVASFLNPLSQAQATPARVQDSSADNVQRRDDAYRSQSAGPGGVAMAQLQDSVMNRLVEKIPGVDIADLRKRDAADFSPDAIAGRISDFVAKGLESARAQGRSDAEVQSLYDNAVRGMERGLSEARDVLEGLNLLQGGIADQVDETAKRMRESLADIDPSRLRDQVDVSGSAGMSIAERYQSSSSFELQLQTQDGDEVTVTFGRSSDVSASAAAYTDSNGNRAAAFSMSRSEQVGYSFSIQGNLSEDETAAIRDLFRDVSQMADDFFGNDIQKAFEQAGSMSFDGSQIASFELNMSQSQQYTAAQAYRETQQIDSPEQNRPGLRLGQLMNEMRDRFSQSVLDFLENPQEVGASMMNALAQEDVRMKDASPENRERLQANLEDLLTSVNQERGAEATPTPS